MIMATGFVLQISEQYKWEAKMEITYFAGLALFIIGFHFGLREAERGLTFRDMKVLLEQLIKKIRGSDRKN